MHLDGKGAGRPVQGKPEADSGTTLGGGSGTEPRIGGLTGSGRAEQVAVQMRRNAARGPGETVLKAAQPRAGEGIGGDPVTMKDIGSEDTAGSGGNSQSSLNNNGSL